MTFVDGGITGLAAILEKELADGLEEPIFNVKVWERMDELASRVGQLVDAGIDPAPFAETLERFPRRNAREHTLYHLLRAVALRDDRAATVVIETLAADLENPDPRHSLIQADYILRGMLFGIWSNRIKLSDPVAHDMAVRRLWRAILNQYRAAMPAPDPVPPAARQRDLVVVMTSQFLSGMHQPSIDAGEFAAKLLLRFGRRVVLINTADGPRSVYYPYLGGFISSVEQHLLGCNQLTVDRLPIPFIHLPGGFTDPAMASSLRDRILDMRPDLVLSFGTMNPVADLCQGLLDVVSIPFGTYLPIAEPGMFALPRALVPSDLPALAFAGLSPERVVHIDYCYTKPAVKQARTKADLGIPADAILTLVIGVRLTAEVTPDFATALNAAIEAEPRLFFLFVGPLDRFDALVADLPALAARSRCHGFDPDVMGLLAAADLFINPPRGGGGASAAYALASGVPAFTLNAGDVATVAGPDFHLPRFADFAPLATRFADDTAYRADMQEKARGRFAAISSRDVMLRQILDGVKAMRAKG